MIAARGEPPGPRPPRGPAPGIIGHRGAPGPGPAGEHAGVAMRYAHGSADVLEFDLRLTADHEIVLMHDATPDRTTNCTGPGRRLDAAQTCATQCRGGGQPIPTFAEVAAYAGTTALGIAPEIKSAGRQ